MVRLILFLAVVAAAATGLAWLADRPGNLVINWEGYEIETSVFRAVVMLAAIMGAALFVWSLLRQLWTSPAVVGQFMARRRQQRGLEALSSGMIAIGAGDRGSATRYAIQARKALPNEPLTHLLRAQAAQLSGDGATSRRIFEAMLAAPDTEQLGLRGLFLEAQREGETEAARQFAERAIRLNPKLVWAVEQLFELQCKDKDWAGALDTIAVARKHGHVEKASADRRRAVLLTAQALEKEDSDPEKALSLAIEAHGQAPDLVPAAALAGRMLASRGNTPRATKIIQKTWTRSPHPDLATAYAYARLGDSPRDRFDRVRQLALLNPMSVESAIAAATAAIEAKAFDEARSALEPFLDGRLTQRICLLMARIEGEQHGNKGRVREWLARAVNAPRDPAWTADGVVSDQWAAVSPVTGALDAFQWRVPVENADTSDSELLHKKLEELVPLGAGLDPVLAAKPVEPAAAAGQRPVEEPLKRADKPETAVRARNVDDAVVVET
ncbi:MAG: heme biosynthesis HemY N-terminal domain-containing protein, partial [Hyphomicrobium sp.]